MARKRLNPETTLSGAEKQKRYRERRKAELDSIIAKANDNADIDRNALKETLKKELKESWEPEIKEERLAAERKKGRELAKAGDHNYKRGRIHGICETANFFISKDRIDIARAILANFYIDRDTAVKELEEDKRTKSLLLSGLDKSGAWGTPPKVIK